MANNRFFIFLVAIYVSVGTCSVFGVDYFTILDSGLSPRSVAVGNISAFGDNALDLFGSPVAGADTANNVSVFYANMMASDMSYMALAGNHNLSKKLSIGAGLMYEKVSGGQSTEMDDDEIIGSDEIEDKTYEVLANMSYEWVKNLYVGVSGHYMYRNVFGVTAQAPALSAGVRYQGHLFDVAFAGHYLNSPEISYSNGGSEVRNAQMVGTLRRRGRLIFPLELLGQGTWVPAKSQLLKGAGVRVHLSEYLSVSGGYMDIPGLGKGSIGKATMGVGLNLGAMSVDYAFNQTDYVENENQHRVSLTIRY